MEAEKKAERTSQTLWQKLGEKTIPPVVGQPKEPLRAEFWKAIYVKRLDNVFYQTQRLGFEQQLRQCVDSAVTDLLQSRTGKAMAANLRADETKKLALEKLNGAKTVELVPNFDERAIQCSIAVRNAVVYAAAALYEKKLPPARATSAGGR